MEYTYLLDWPYAVDPSAPLLEVTQFHLMQNWKNVGYFSGSIQYQDQFLLRHKSFLVVRAQPEPLPAAAIPSGNPLIDRFKHTPGYEVVPYGNLHRYYFRDVVDLVCEGSCTDSNVPQPAAPIDSWMPGVSKEQLEAHSTHWWVRALAAVRT